MNLTTIGIDFAKNMFSLHGTDAVGKTVLIKTAPRGKLLEFFANLPPCTAGKEVCAGANHWARGLQAIGQ